MASTSSSATASCSKAAAARRVEGGARLGQPERARAAVDERRADLALEAGHDLRNRRLRVVEPVGGQGERPRIADCLKYP